MPLGTLVRLVVSSLSRGFQNCTCNIMSLSVKLNKGCFSFFFYSTSYSVFVLLPPVQERQLINLVSTAGN